MKEQTTIKTSKLYIGLIYFYFVGILTGMIIGVWLL